MFISVSPCNSLSNNSYQALDVGMLLRKAATFSTPVMEITEADGTWSIKTSTTMKTMELKFKVLEIMGVTWTVGVGRV